MSDSHGSCQRVVVVSWVIFTQPLRLKAFSALLDFLKSNIAGPKNVFIFRTSNLQSHEKKQKS